jgi:hypothetical protein
MAVTVPEPPALIGAAVMIAGGLVEVFLGVAAERRSLADVATPLSLVRMDRPRYQPGIAD